MCAPPPLFMVLLFLLFQEGSGTQVFFGVSHSALFQQMKHHSTTERLSFELGELSKSKRELLEVVEHKNAELDEKNATIKSYLTKVVGVVASLLSCTSLPVWFNPQTPVAVLSVCAAGAHKNSVILKT